MDYEKNNEALDIVKRMVADGQVSQEVAEKYFPELKESEDEKIREKVIDVLKLNIRGAESQMQASRGVDRTFEVYACNKVIALLEKQGKQTSDPRYIILDKLIEADNIYQMSVNDAMVQEAKTKAIDALSKLEIGNLLELEKQGEQKPCMIQWKGDNLKEVIDFTGKDKNFDKWFKSFEEYEKFVREHEGILKLFNEDGSHYEVPVGAWIVKTPDGRNVASKAVFKKMPAWGEEDKEMSRFIGNAITANDASEYLGSKGIQVIDVHVWLYELKDRVQPQSNHWKPSEGCRKVIVGSVHTSLRDGSDNHQ